MARGGFLDRGLRAFGLQRVKASSDGGNFRGASVSRIYADWAFAGLSPDQKIRGSLKRMRDRSRQLVGDNDYAKRFLNLVRENVIGSNGITLQMTLDEKTFGAQATELNQKIESAWMRFCDTCTVDRKMSMVDAAQMEVASKLQDGEVFVRKVKGFPNNPFRFALQFLDPDQVDAGYERLRRATGDGSQSEIRMGVELDQWRGPLAYWVYDGHPSETASVRRARIPAEEVIHDYPLELINQTRGVPWLHAAMTRLHMLGKYEEAEVVAARVAACKMLALVTKPEGGVDPDPNLLGDKNKKGEVEISIEPASFFELPYGMDAKGIDWNHPNVAFSDFLKAMLRGAAAGANVSYSSLTGDLREVNFSSLRQGVLSEREGWRVLQTSAIRHFYQPVFADWLAMAITTGQLDVPTKTPYALLLEAATWTPRGWDWVDPVKDVVADMHARGACMTTLQDIAAKRGKDWRDIADQIAAENEYLRSKGIDPNFSPVGGVQNASPDTNEQDNAAPPAGASLMGARI
jgi:lambda family phage portal protein